MFSRGSYQRRLLPPSLRRGTHRRSRRPSRVRSGDTALLLSRGRPGAEPLGLTLRAGGALRSFSLLACDAGSSEGNAVSLCYCEAGVRRRIARGAATQNAVCLPGEAVCLPGEVCYRMRLPKVLVTCVGAWGLPWQRYLATHCCARFSIPCGWLSKLL